MPETTPFMIGEVVRRYGSGQSEIEPVVGSVDFVQDLLSVDTPTGNYKSFLDVQAEVRPGIRPDPAVFEDLFKRFNLSKDFVILVAQSELKPTTFEFRSVNPIYVAAAKQHRRYAAVLSHSRAWTHWLGSGLPGPHSIHRILNPTTLPVIEHNLETLAKSVSKSGQDSHAEQLRKTRNRIQSLAWPNDLMPEHYALAELHPNWVMEQLKVDISPAARSAAGAQATTSRVSQASRIVLNARRICQKMYALDAPKRQQ